MDQSTAGASQVQCSAAAKLPTDGMKGTFGTFVQKSTAASILARPAESEAQEAERLSQTPSCGPQRIGKGPFQGHSRVPRWALNGRGRSKQRLYAFKDVKI